MLLREGLTEEALHDASHQRAVEILHRVFMPAWPQVRSVRDVRLRFAARRLDGRIASSEDLSSGAALLCRAA